MKVGVIRLLAIIAAIGLFLPNCWADPVYVVKVINFSCPYCRQSEPIDARIDNAAKAAGGGLSWAPVTPQGPDAADRVYFASRYLGPDASDKIRAALYKGRQDNGQPFENITQTLVYLQQELDTATWDWRELGVRAMGPAAEDSVIKALRLAKTSSVDAVPAYVIIYQGEIVAILDTSVPNTAKFPQLREAVIAKITQLSKRISK